MYKKIFFTFKKNDNNSFLIQILIGVIIPHTFLEKTIYIFF